MGRIIVIPNSDFSKNRIEKVDIEKQVDKSVDSQNPTLYSSSTKSVIKNNVQ